MKKWFVGICPDGTVIRKTGHWDHVRKHFDGLPGIRFTGSKTEAAAERWLGSQVSPLELELRERLDPLPDGPLVRGRPFKEAFMDVWVRSGRKSVSKPRR